MILATSFFIRLWSAILLIIFLVVMALGIVAVVLLSGLRSVGVGIIVFALLGVIISIFGCIGGSFDKTQEREKQNSKIFIVCFFGGLVILHTLFAIFGVALIFLRASIKMIINLPSHDFDKLYGEIPHLANTIPGTVEKLKGFMLGVGIFLIVVSVAILITCIITAIRMGKELFAKNYIVAFSLIEIIIGFAIASFLLFLNISREYAIFGNAIGKKVIFPIIVFGFLLAIVGFVGFFILCCKGNKNKCVSVAFNTGNVVICIAFLVLFILCIVLRKTIENWARGVCTDNVEEIKYCGEVVDRTNVNLCSRFSNQDPETCGDYTGNDFLGDIEKMVQNFVIVLLFVCLYLVLFLIVVVVPTCHNYLHPPEDDYPRPKVKQYSHQFIDFY